MAMTQTIQIMQNGIVLLCLGYSCLDTLKLNRTDIMGPMKTWLIVSYVNAVVVMSLYEIRERFPFSRRGANFNFDSLRQPSKVDIGVMWLSRLTWGVMLPFFGAWTVLGTLWFIQVLVGAPGCLLHGSYPWLVLFWQLQSYAFLSTHFSPFMNVLANEWRLRKSGVDLQDLENLDSLGQWGLMPSVDANHLQTLNQPRPGRGMQPADIHALPVVEFHTTAAAAGQDSTPHCSICLSDFVEGERLRCLPGCGHCFHDACIDLWLLRQADCPMCKQRVQ